jgi:putative copper export protein
VRIALIGAALVFLWWTTRFTGRQSIGIRNTASARTRGQARHTFAWFALAGFILLTLAVSEDITQLAQAHVSAVILDWLFLAAQGIWFGGAAYLGFVLLPLLPAIEPELHARSLVTLLQRYTPLILGSIAVLLVSGLFLAETSLSSVQQLITDPFGRALLVKIILVAMMLLLSAYALLFLGPQLRRQVMLLHVVHAEMPARRTRQSALERNERRLTVTMKFLAYLGAGVLLCAAFMSFFAPPIVFPAIDYTSNTSGSSTTPSTTNNQITQTKQSGNLTVNLQITPARVDYDNTVIVTMNDNNGNPVTDAQVQISINMVTMNMGVASATIKGGNPTYVAVLSKDETFSMPGLWNVVLKIQRPNQKPVQVSFQVTLA